MSEQKHSPEPRPGITRRGFMHRGAAAALAGATLAQSKTARAQKRSPNERIGVGVIGVGGRGGGHLNVLKELRAQGEVDIVAVCDVYRPRLTRAAKRFDAPDAYMDYRELLENPKVDLVSIATPDHHHAVQAIDAMKAGKDVYCEKPVTHWRQFDQIKELARVAEETGRVFQLGTQGMSDSAWHQMAALVKEGLIGQPLLAECGYFRVGDWGERGMNVDDPEAKPGPDLDWEAFLGDSPERDFDVSRFFRWRLYEDYAGGPVTDLYPHSLTPVTSILDVKFPDSAVAIGGIERYDYELREVPDTFNMMLDYPGGVSIMVLGTQANDYSGTGARGAGSRVPVVRGWDGPLTLQGEEIVFIPAHGSDKKEQRFAIEKGENMLHHYQNLLECVRKGETRTWSPADLAYYTQTALIMGMLAWREGKTARFDAEKETIVI